MGDSVLVTSQSFVITSSWQTRYDMILSAPELTIESCSIVYPT